METYRYTKIFTSKLKYCFAFCPRYKRKIFLIPNVETRFTKLVIKECSRLDISIIDLTCKSDHVILIIEAPPLLSPAEIMKCVKGATSRVLREEFSELSAMPSLWTKNFFVSTDAEVPMSDIEEFIKDQKSHP